MGDAWPVESAAGVRGLRIGCKAGVRMTEKPKRKHNPDWPSAKRDRATGANKARATAVHKRFAEVTGYATPAKLVAAIEAGEVSIVKR